jgi:uncharacterized protein YbjT (DUF2867 family)
MIVVTGATGSVGQVVVSGLLARGAATRVLVRSPEKAAPWNEGATPGHEPLQVVRGDLGVEDEVRRALEGASQVFLLSNANAAHEETVLRVARAQGVARVVKLSSLGARPDSPIDLARDHARVETALRGSGLAWVILRPGMFAQNFLRFGSTIRSVGKIFGAVGQGKVAPIDVRDIGDVAVATLVGSERGQPAAAYDGQVLALTGDEAFAYTDLAAIFTAQLRKQVDYIDLPAEALRQNLEQAGLPPFIAADLVRFQEAIARGESAQVSPTVREVLGRPARTFAAFVSENTAAFS